MIRLCVLPITCVLALAALITSPVEALQPPTPTPIAWGDDWGELSTSERGQILSDMEGVLDSIFADFHVSWLITGLAGLLVFSIVLLVIAIFVKRGG